MTDWIFQGNGKQLDLDAATAALRLRWGNVPPRDWIRSERTLDLSGP